MKLKEFMNPQHKQPDTVYGLDMELELLQLDIGKLTVLDDEYINITDKDGNSAGGIRRELLVYLLESMMNKQFLPILEQVSEAVIAIDADSRIFFVNQAYYKMLGVPIGKIIGRYMNQIEPNAGLLGVLKTGKSVQIKNQHIETVNRYVNCRMFPLYKDGEVCGAFSVFTDHTRLHHMSQQVEQISGLAQNYSEQITSLQTLKDLNIIGEDKAYRNCIEQALLAAQTDVTVLICGENGTGKEVFTNLIKENSNRRSKPFITVNCSAIPENLIESELFGYEAGSFTGGSKNGRMGKFQLAHGGTIFLDEIGDMPLHMQAKLLRVLQNGEIEKIGRQKTIPIDVRVIAATNQPLEEMIEKKLFRADLYYRLNVVTIYIPPLRARGNDIILLADHFLAEFNKKYHKQTVLSTEVYERMLTYSWPGNVRELINVMERGVILCQNEEIQLQQLPGTFGAGVEAPPPHFAAAAVPAALPTALPGITASILAADSGGDAALPPVKADCAGNAAFPHGKEEGTVLSKTEMATYGLLGEEMDAYEKKVLEETLIRFGGNKAKAMEALGVSRRTFYRKLAYHGIH